MRRFSILLFAGLFSLRSLGAEPVRDFAIPEPGHVFSFPADHGSHPAFKIEWWYVTGHLWSHGTRRFGFQATFFRFAGKPASPNATPAFGEDQLYLAHMAVSDLANHTFISDERINRAGWDAHAAVGGLDVANGSWFLRGNGQPSPVIQLSGSVDARAAFDLTLTPAKPLVVFGEDGVSHKGPEKSAASYYLTFSRLKTAGHLTIGGETLDVDGEAWMDHEISSSQLSHDEVGWDWVCIQLKDQSRELMLYRLRHADGSADAASKLQWVDPQGKAITAPFTWEVLSTWPSPSKGPIYPSRIRLTTRDPASGKDVHYTLEPLLPDQELREALGGAYWEGACRVLNDEGEEVGSAYLELTGYAKALKL
jgi:predicted secreted hydrolase